MKKQQEKYDGCHRGGIVLIHHKEGWKVEEWEEGKAPSHEHYFWDLMRNLMPGRETIHPTLKEFPINHGIIIGVRSEMLPSLPYYLLDGIVLL